MRKNEYKQLKHEIMALGLVIPGTVRIIYLRCGKEGCCCALSAKEKHGPYYLWDRKVNGRLSSKSIPEVKTEVFKQWIENRKKLEAIIRKMLVFGQYQASQAAERKNNAAVGNSKKPLSAKRGK